MLEKPFSQACENNKAPILLHLKRLFKNTKNVLEIGSGTGQHAVYFAQHMPHLNWQTSDRAINHNGIHLWLNEHPKANLLAPIELDVTTYDWAIKTDAVYSANTAHIMPWKAVTALFEGVGKSLNKDGLFVLYGPFNYGGKFTSPSNARFDEHLKLSEPTQGIRDYERICALAKSAGLKPVEDNPMPANNRLLVFKTIGE